MQARAIKFFLATSDLLQVPRNPRDGFDAARTVDELLRFIAEMYYEKEMHNGYRSEPHDIFTIDDNTVISGERKFYIPK